MILNKSYSFLSIFSTIIGTILLIVSYLILPENQEIKIIITKFLFSISIIILLLSIIFGTKAIINKEIGIKKYIGIILTMLITLFVVLIPILMGIGFIINNNP